jgi:hypothetical protein
LRQTISGRALLFIVGLMAVGGFLSYAFGRRIGGAGGGSEKASVGAWVLLTAIIVGIMVGTRGPSGLRSHSPRVPHLE